MITDKELQLVKLSPTKKDYYQIWNELLETASKISNRWDPTSTNESDPGIVLLKVLTAVADKLNYNIDKNILEAFMPSAAQEESMRKLCEMMGYSVKYYQSAKTTVQIVYDNKITKDESNNNIRLDIPRFTIFSNAEKDLYYISTVSKTINPNNPSVTIECIEGTLEHCETINDNKIIYTMLDDNFRYYLPETQIAENGIFVSSTNFDADDWQQVDNLNTQSLKTECYKFGYDSKLNLPYLQFPEDIGDLIGEGLRINYIRTNGANGNTALNTLTTFELPTSASYGSWTNSDITIDNFVVSNITLGVGGKNIETIKQAYNNYKKTIGTFDTLVTCRDYMNKIYQLLDEELNIPLVSNIIVSDIKDDINMAKTLCTFDDYGIKYIDTPVLSSGNDRINNFNIVLYPFKTIFGLNTKTEYTESFKYSTENLALIENKLQASKSICHALRIPTELATDIVGIKNYLKLNARITTATKVNFAEEDAILRAVRTAIYSQFNMRNLDFGEEIPFDDILTCIENADTRIKNVSLDEPILYTVAVTADNKEYNIASVNDNTNSDSIATAKQLYNKLALRNILAGRIKLFDYNTEFTPSFNEKAYNHDDTDDDWNIASNPSNPIDEIISECTINVPIDTPIEPESGETSYTYTSNSMLTPGNIVLAKNEIIQFRAPSFKTTITYPAYVNYYFRTDTSIGGISAIPATFYALKDFLLDPELADSDVTVPFAITGVPEIFVSADGATYSENRVYFTESDNTYTVVVSPVSTELENYYVLNDSADGFFTKLNTIVKAAAPNSIYKGLFRRLPENNSRVTGKYIDASLYKYILCTTAISGLYPEQAYYVQQIHETDTDDYTKDGIGRDAAIPGIPANTEYSLGTNDALYVNYTPSSDDTSGATVKEVTKIYGPGTIIRPNFKLIDSDTVNSRGASYSKTLTTPIDNIQNMFTLGSNEQLEIRERIQVKLKIDDEDTSGIAKKYNLYWELNKVSDLKDALVQATENDPGYYTLQENEYIYYTNENKLDMAYYGNGTEIEVSASLISRLVKNKSKEITAEELLTKGAAVVPWTTVAMNDPTDDFIYLNEYKYVNLSEKDELVSIEFKYTDPTIHEQITDTQNYQIVINNTWKDITKASYKINNGDTKDLPNLIVTTLNWEVRSILNMNFGPSYAQKLSKTNFITDSLKVSYYNSTTGTPIMTGTTRTATTITPNATSDKLAVKSNYVCKSTSGNLNVKKIFTDTKLTNDFKLQFVDLSQPAGIYTTTDDVVNYGSNYTGLPFNNFQNNWTKINITDTTEPTNKIILNINIPTDTFGLLMIYYITSLEAIATASAEDTREHITLSSTSGQEITYYAPELLNNALTDNTSLDYTWDNVGLDTTNHKYTLKNGINVIKIENSCTLDISTTDSTGTLIISDLAIVNAPAANLTGVNNNVIQYQQINVSSAQTQLLLDIKAADTNNQFYYNMPMTSNYSLNINDRLTGNDIERLNMPKLYYDYNNVNNKFVISEIDADYLETGLIIPRSSKL